MKHILFIVLFFYGIFLSAQNLPESFRHHIYYLSHDSLEGRQTGSKGEQIAYNYIINQFKKYGISAKGSNDYLQPFPFSHGKELGKNNSLSINGFHYGIYGEYYPLSYTSNDSVTAKAVNTSYGIQSKKLKRDDYANTQFKKGDIAIINIGLPDITSKKLKHLANEFTALESRIKIAEQKGAAGIIFIKENSREVDPDEQLSTKIKSASIPVVFLQHHIWENLKNQKQITATIITQTFKTERTAHNVIAYIDNNAEKTVVIGAHYDHLGYNEHHHSLYKGEPAIHNGADDNASGIAAIIELANYLKISNLKNRNYLFIAFSGEELGLLGSNYFVSNTTIDLNKVDYMLNYDMVGRLDQKLKTLTINGIGTSPQFNIVKNIQIDSLMLQTTTGGIGPSDHTSFYLKNIPVLHFFSGIHNDYHKPSDDADKINLNGMESIFKFSIALIDSLNKTNKIVFTKTKDNTHGNGSSAASFKVTLGIVPGYAYSGKGLRIDGVSEGKPAQKAGLSKDDIIIQLGKFPVEDIQQYMKALGQFSKGDKTTVTILRNFNKLKFKVQF